MTNGCRGEEKMPALNQTCHQGLWISTTNDFMSSASEATFRMILRFFS
jgi:hypothetical protein